MVTPSNKLFDIRSSTFPTWQACQRRNGLVCGHSAPHYIKKHSLEIWKICKKKRILILLSKQLLILYFSQETFTTASFTWLYLLPFHIRVISRANYLMVGTQNQKRPNRDMEKKIKIIKQLVQTQYIQGNWSWKKNKKNKPTNQSANKSLFVQNLRSLFIAVSPAIVMWTR